MKFIPGLLISLSASLLVVGCGGGSPSKSGGGAAAGAGSNTLEANIRWTEFGIPHIKADDWPDLGFGVGYAYAWDNICTLADDIVMIDGERSKFFGPDETHSIISAFTVTNRENDFAMKLLINDAKMAEFAAAQSERSVELADGYVAGYNRYLNELRAGEHPGRHQACRDEPWLRELTRMDLFRRYLRLAMLASSTVFRDGIANATPPVGGGGAVISAPASSDEPSPLEQLNDLPIGSNMYGIGPDGTKDGSTMLLGNPHFPWYGPERLHAFHVTIPGVVDTMGSGLHGVPGPLIAFNEKFAWSHTVSAAYRFTLYELSLNPANPKQYLFDGAMRDMVETEITIEVLQPDGSLADETRTLHSSHYGPILTVASVPVAGGLSAEIGWTSSNAYTLRDANYENTRLIDQFISWNAAENFDDFRRLHRDILAVPWVNTVAIGPDAPAYYGDVTVVPNVPDEMLVTEAEGGEGCAAQPLHGIIQQLVPGLPVLDGSSSDCDWKVDDDSPQPGTFGVANLPSLLRDDHVHNCNDSYWLTNPDQPIVGFARIIGDEDAARSLRTRLCIRQLQERMDGSDGLVGTKFDLEQFQEVVLGSRVYTAEIARDDVISDLCAGATGDVETACNVLAAWDMKTEINSIGAHIWREFWTRADNANVLWNTPYDSADPVNTPRDLNTSDPTVQQALPDAVSAIVDAGIALDARFGTVQYDVKNGEQIEMYGGLGSVGNFTITIPQTGLTDEGYPVVDYGNSWVYSVQYKDDKVLAQGYVTYSQSTDPASPHYSDYTKAYANKEWPLLPFYEEDIEAMKIREMTISQ